MSSPPSPQSRLLMTHPQNKKQSSTRQLPTVNNPQQTNEKTSIQQTKRHKYFNAHSAETTHPDNTHRSLLQRHPRNDPPKTEMSPYLHRPAGFINPQGAKHQQAPHAGDSPTNQTRVYLQEFCPHEARCRIQRRKTKKKQKKEKKQNTIKGINRRATPGPAVPPV